MAAINPKSIAGESPERAVLKIPVNMPINPVSLASISAPATRVFPKLLRCYKKVFGFCGFILNNSKKYTIKLLKLFKNKSNI
jgi:hypothetical protein